MGKDEYSGENEYESSGELVDLAEQPEVDTGGSSVATAPGSRMAIMIVVGVGLLAFMYYMFFAGGEEQPDKADVKQPVEVPSAPSVPLDTSESAAPAMPALPAPPPIAIPTPPPPPKTAELIPMVPAPPPPMLAPETPQAAPEAPTPPVIAEGESEEAKQRRLARLKSGMLVMGGGGGGGSSSGTAAEGEAAEGGEKKEGLLDKVLPQKKEFGNTNFRLTRTNAEQEDATLTARDMSAVVAQGKIIDAVLETAINTDIPGQLRAVISRDVYAEIGKNILLPKGTRLIGSYQSEVKRGEKRIQIIWTRAIRPDGIDIAIQSPGTDQLGRSGVDGVVDNRYFELFSNAILLSTVTGLAAILAEEATGTSGITSTTSAEGTTTQSGKPSDFAIMEGIQNLGNITKGIGNDLLKTKPTITVDQGTRIKVFVNRDLIFPASVASNVKFVQ